MHRLMSFGLILLIATACGGAATPTATPAPTDTPPPTPTVEPTATDTEEPISTPTEATAEPTPTAETIDAQAVGTQTVEFEADGIIIGNPWVRPARSANTAAYMSITNTTDDPVTLIGASVDFADMAQIHRTTVQDDVARMEQIEGGLTIDPDETIYLQPASYHVMVMNINSPLEGGTRPLTLTFDNETTITVDAQVSDQPPR